MECEGGVGAGAPPIHTVLPNITWLRSGFVTNYQLSYLLYQSLDFIQTGCWICQSQTQVTLAVQRGRGYVIITPRKQPVPQLQMPVTDTLYAEAEDVGLRLHGAFKVGQALERYVLVCERVPC